VEEATPSLTLIIRDEGLRLLTAVGAPEVSNACGESVRPGEIQARLNEAGINSIHARFNLTCQSTLNCSDHAPKYAPSLVLVLLALISAIALLPATQLNLKKPLKYPSGG